MIDPETGLELEVLKPAPAMRADQPWMGEQAIQAQPTESVSSAAPSTAPMRIGTPSPIPQEMPLPKSSFFDQVLFTLLGTPDSKLSPEEAAKKQAGRRHAQALSKSAAENPGEAFMGIPSVDGGGLEDFGAKLGKIISGVGKLL